MGKAATSNQDTDALSHNLLGQKLGRKGRDTRERILAATDKLLSGPPDNAISLSAVAREASLGMTTLYLYFADLTELLLAVIEPIVATAEASYIGQVRARWSDETLHDDCLKFVKSFHEYWARNSRVLHLRNSYADNNDIRLREQRIKSSEPLIMLLSKQMDMDVRSEMAVVLLTGMERVITMSTDPTIMAVVSDPVAHVQRTLVAQARVLELGIRDGRAQAAAAKA